MILRADARHIPLADESVDSIVTDPPYELGFMGKKWDSSGVTYSLDVWREALRVLKPGGHLLAFGGSRTYHRLACAVEDAGFEVRDQIMWIYGSGFPKSLDVSKAIDKAAGAEREVVGEKGLHKFNSTRADKNHGKYGKDFRTFEDANALTAPATDAARHWSGWGTALKPAHEPIVVARKPLIGTVTENVLKHGTGAISNKIISPDLYARLVEASKDKLPEAWLFTNGAGKPFHVTQVSWMWRKAADSVGVSCCLYVASRHSRVSQLREELERRVAEELRAELMHKSSVTTLRHYVREKEGG